MNPNDKVIRDLHKLLSGQNFQFQEEIETFMQNKWKNNEQKF